MGCKQWLASTSSIIKWIVVIRVYLLRSNKSRKILLTPFNFPDFDGCSIVTESRGFAILSVRLLVLWKSLYLVESSWINCLHMWLSKFLFIKMSTTTWYQVDFNFTALPLLTWIELIIRVANNLLSFVFTTGLCVEYKFLGFRCEDSFIVLLNVSWRPKWFSKSFFYFHSFDLKLEPREGLHVVAH